jgi:hypothetical protein
MLVVKKITRNEDGSYEAVWNLSEEQMNFLITFAINELVQEGLVQVQEFHEKTEAQLQMDFLDAVDSEEMPRA